MENYLIKKSNQCTLCNLINIKINEDDTTNYANDLVVTSQKLKKVVNFVTETKFKKEALQIFDLIENNSDQIS